MTGTIYILTIMYLYHLTEAFFCFKNKMALIVALSVEPFLIESKSAKLKGHQFTFTSKLKGLQKFKRFTVVYFCSLEVIFIHQ